MTNVSLRVVKEKTVAIVQLYNGALRNCAATTLHSIESEALWKR